MLNPFHKSLGDSQSEGAHCKMGHFKVVPLLPVVAELQGYKQVLAHGPALACPLSWASTRAHPAATGIWGILRRVRPAQLPGKQWDSRLG